MADKISARAKNLSITKFGDTQNLAYDQQQRLIGNKKRDSYGLTQIQGKLAGNTNQD